LTSVFTQISGAMNRGVLPDPSFIGSSKRPLMKKEATPKRQKSHYKTSDKKRGNPNNEQGLIKETFDEKIGNQKNAKGLIKETSDEKRGNPKNTEGLTKRTSDEKIGSPKKRKGAH
jgi:hypothetical protein